MQIIFEGINGDDEIYMDCLRAICGNTEGGSMADLCCNLAPHTPLLGFKNRFYVDILPRTLDHKEEQQYFIRQDIFDFLKVNNSFKFDTLICSDGIEHLTDEMGIELLKRMQLYSKRMVLFTPLGEHLVDREGTEPEGHHSGWTPDILKSIWPEDMFAYIVFPQYHPTLGIGAFFFWRCNNLKEDFERVTEELKQKSWTKLN